ncbi:MAG: TetR/AcrR family transcriptional regulator [Methylophilaceae bacterium]|nr:TetR/AcrR family transcriptional regulator [Methylophilaceae bacterium]
MTVRSLSPETADPCTARRILAAAEALFAEQGFDAVSMSAIAERAGVSKANIFHHFNSKNALYLAVLNHVCEESRARVDLLEQAQGSFRERLTQYAAAHLRGLLEHDQLTRLILRDVLEHGPERGKVLAEQVFGRNFAKLVDIIRSGQSRGELRPDIDPAMVAVMMIAANLYFFQAKDILRHFADVDFADDPQRYSTKLLDLMLHGILPSEKTP